MMTCTLLDKTYGPASGKTKKEAEQAAASLGYDAIMSSGGSESQKLLSIKKL